MRVRPLALSSALVIVACLVAGSAVDTQAKPPQVAPSCGQRGRVVFDKDTVLTDASGRRVARFSGGESAVTLLAPPVEGSDQARIETGTGRGSFRIQGSVPASELRTFVNSDVPIVDGHVWLTAATRVVATGTSAGKVKIVKRMTAPFDQPFAALTECRSLTFTPPERRPARVPTNARLFVMKAPLLELYDDAAPRGKVVATLQRSPLADSVRFFSSESRAGFVHLRYEGEVGIDGWAKASDLEPLPRGEAVDVPPATYTLSTPPELQLPQPPRVVQTKREVALRVAARDAETPIGVVEADTELYIMDTAGGWANVLPKTLHVLPADNLSFWVKAVDLGL